MTFLEDSLVLALGRAIKTEEAAEKALTALALPFVAHGRGARISPTRSRQMERAYYRVDAARKNRLAAEAELEAFRRKGPIASQPHRVVAIWKDGMKEVLTHGYLTLHEAQTVASKFSPYPKRRIMVEQAP